MKKLFLIPLAAALITTLPVFAQEAPTPHRSPRDPVHRQALPDRKPELPPSHLLEGQAMVVDSEKLRIGSTDMRLFGIVPPQLAASFGPQARAVLDKLVAGQNVSCLVRDRDHDGRLLVTCRAGTTADLALEMLRRGLAVTARGSLTATDLAGPYLAAEQAAQAQKIGLWSVTAPAPAAVAETPVRNEPPAANSALALAETSLLPNAPATDVKKEDKAAKTDKTDSKTVADKTAADKALIKSAPIVFTADAEMKADEMAAASTRPGFFERYQILVTGFIMLATALGILGVVSIQRRTEKREEMKAIAAALRGELMAARAVCQSRLKAIVTDADEKNTAWPRIRVTLYQAYVGRLGWLGAGLARQVASIYGQASDYAGYYGENRERPDGKPKRQALRTLADHIDEVLPKLAAIEQTGRMDMTRLSSASFAAGERPGSDRSSSTPLWNAIREFARVRLAANAGDQRGTEAEYAALIEEDMKGLSFAATESSEPEKPLLDNVTKLHGT